MNPNSASVEFYFDPISPYAYLAFHALPQALAGLNVHVRYRPVLFAAMLKAAGQRGPAEIAGKREWTYRQVLWQAREMGIDMQLPNAHPFNPLPLLRAMLAAGDGQGCVNRWVVQQVMDHVWQGGADPLDGDRLAALVQSLQAHRAAAWPKASALTPDAVKALLVKNTDAALDRGVFGVPTCEFNGALFWGLDALPMLKQAVAGDAWFGGSEWAQAASIPVGVERKI